MKKRILAMMLALAMTVPMGLAACNKTPDDGGNNDDPSNGTINNGGNTNGGDDVNNKPDDDKKTPVDDAADWYTDYGTVSNEEYNKNLYFLNELKFEVADPSVIYIDHGEEEGYFYAYGTSDMVGGHGIQCWRSKDLTNWEYKSVAYRPDFSNTWASRNHWAPEVLFDEESDMYIMVYNADYVEGDTYQTNWATKGDQSKSLTIVTSENPYGPFVPIKDELATKPAYDFSPRNSLIPKELQRSNTIDGHFYIDPVTGDKYLYYSGYGHDGVSDKWHAQTLFGVKMKNWTEPDYSTLKELTKNSKTTVDLPDNVYDIVEGSGEYENTVNEGAFMWYKDGTYYLTYSVYAFTESQYQVRQAVSDSPMGPFRKIQPDDGGQIIVTDPAWDTITSAGHHCFITCGDKLMIAYHTFLNRNDIDNGRALAVDTISWVKNDKGETLMHANGPTYSYQPLPEEISGYKNLAPLAKITANNTADDSSVKYLNDDTLKIHSYDPVQEFTTKGGKTEITLDFGKFVNARSILVYNASDYDKAFTEISSIKLRCKGEGDETVEKTIKDVPFDFAWHSDEWSVIYPGANSIVEFNELPVDKITITINAGAEDIISINEIVVLGKEVKNAAAVQPLKSYSYTSPADVSFIPVYESDMFGSAGNGYFKSDYGFDLSHDDGTENAYVEKDWAGNLQNLYFKDVESTIFYVEVELSVGDYTLPFAGDPAPKAGIVMRSRNNYFVSFNIDYTTSFTNERVGFVQSKSDGSDYDWSNYTTYETRGLKYTGENYAKLGVARIGSDIYLFANDRLVATYDTLRGFSDNENTACALSLVTFNCYTKFRNYGVTTNLDEVKTKLTSLGVQLPEEE